jgi:hypothetical protein
MYSLNQAPDSARLMSACAPTAAEKQTSLDFRDGPILLQNSLMRDANCALASILVLASWLPLAPLEAMALEADTLARSTRPQAPPDASRHTWAGQRWRSGDELGQPAEVLRDRCQRELKLGTARPAQAQAAEP